MPIVIPQRCNPLFCSGIFHAILAVAPTAARAVASFEARRRAKMTSIFYPLPTCHHDVMISLNPRTGAMPLLMRTGGIGMHRIGLPMALLLGVFSLPPADAVAQDHVPQVESRAETLPDDFHGKVSYFGNYSGTLSTWKADDARHPPIYCKEGGRGCGGRVGGSLQVDLEFQGVIVRGSFRGSGGLHDSGLIGRRQGSFCRLFDLTDGSVWIGKCDGSGFKGEVHSVPNAPTQLSTVFEAVGTSTIDYTERDRRRQEAIDTQRNIDFLHNIIASGTLVDDRVIASIKLDSYTWPYDRLIQSSVVIARRGRPRRGAYEIQAVFDLQGGGRGFAKAQIVNDSIACLEFWDHPGKCRAVNQPPPINISAYDDPPRTSFVMPKELIIPRGADDLPDRMTSATN
ncbi:hypothetical protein ACLB0R_00630 [Sphingomonas sp. GlSt437]|uniref:hypothetical protein n=1 Tax=Sphingomonas sp. GlSt437 TaxID=3389970 RepID=UPI003EBCD741